ncbi:MAG: protein kinase [Acidobacteria bacterium]|nr:protein kinase [Acidobacteriota bacterium]
MTPQRYTQVKSLFQLVLDQPAPQRQPFLEKACGADRQLYLEVINLLQSDSSSPDFLSHPAITPVSQLLEEANRQPEEPNPAYIGPYAIQRQLGAGGMGTVYLASRADQHYSKLVALKVIRLGMEQERIIQRFRRERQIVASLDHPNIARLLDGGAAADGRPYFVMEYVEGHAIDTFCDQQKLSTENRLRILCDVCAAVHYAHQNLVVHRDLKPGNILVKADGTPKLLDFGIAKILAADPTAPTEHTATSLRLMTPQYASPEQLRGEPVTTVSDVYLLGIILYEILTGHRPYPPKERLTLDLLLSMNSTEPEPPSAALSRIIESPNPDGTRRITKNPTIISSTREPSPAALRRKLQGDLDAVILKALRRNPQDRYQSAAQLADDIRRYLARQPVTALPDRPAHRLRLFLARHRALAATVAAALSLVLLFALLAAWQARTARLQADLAARRFEEVRHVANSFLFEVHDAIDNLPGAPPARRLLAAKAVQYLSNLSREQPRDPSLRTELAAAWIRLGNLQGNPNHPNLGDLASARQSYRNAHQLLSALPQTSPLNLAAALTGLADLEATTGEPQRAREHYAAARQLHDTAGAAPATRAENYQHLAATLAATGRHHEALPLARQAHDLAAHTAIPRLLAQTAAQLGTIETQLGLYPQATTHLEAALRMAEQNYETTPTALHQRDLSLILEAVAGLHRAQNTTHAATHLQRSLALRRTLAAADPHNLQAQRDLAYTLLQQHDLPAAREALSLFNRHLSSQPNNPTAERDAALANQRLGDLLVASNQPLQAADHYRRFVRHAQRCHATEPGNLPDTQMLAAAHRKLGQTLPLLADPNGALDNLRRAVNLLDDAQSQDPASYLLRRDRALANFQLGLHLLTTKAAPALPHLTQANVHLEALNKANQLPPEDRPVLEELRRTLKIASSGTR